MAFFRQKANPVGWALNDKSESANSTFEESNNQTEVLTWICKVSAYKSKSIHCRHLVVHVNVQHEVIIVRLCERICFLNTFTACPLFTPAWLMSDWHTLTLHAFSRSHTHTQHLFIVACCAFSVFFFPRGWWSASSSLLSVILIFTLVFWELSTTQLCASVSFCYLINAG